MLPAGVPHLFPPTASNFLKVKDSKGRLTSKRGITSAENAAIGLFAGAVAGAITNPFDVVRTQATMRTWGGRPWWSASNSASMMPRIFAEQGWRGLLAVQNLNFPSPSPIHPLSQPLANWSANFVPVPRGGAVAEAEAINTITATIPLKVPAWTLLIPSPNRVSLHFDAYDLIGESITPAGLPREKSVRGYWSSCILLRVRKVPRRGRCFKDNVQRSGQRECKKEEEMTRNVDKKMRWTYRRNQESQKNGISAHLDQKGQF